MGSSITCCKGCKDRQVGCHSTCERYIREKNEYNKKSYMIRQKIEREQMMVDPRANRLFGERRIKPG